MSMRTMWVCAVTSIVAVLGSTEARAAVVNAASRRHQSLPHRKVVRAELGCSGGPLPRGRIG